MRRFTHGGRWIRSGCHFCTVYPASEEDRFSKRFLPKKIKLLKSSSFHFFWLFVFWSNQLCQGQENGTQYQGGHQMEVSLSHFKMWSGFVLSDLFLNFDVGFLWQWQQNGRWWSFENNGVPKKEITSREASIITC